MSQEKSADVDMLHGPLAKKLLLFAVPVAVIGVLQQLFNAADVAVLGQFVGKHAMAAVGSNTPVIGSLVSLLLGLSLGANVMIAFHLGGGREDRVRRAVQTSVVISVLAGFVIMLLGEALAWPFLWLLGTPDEVIGDAASYLRCFLLGVPGISLYNFVAAVIRSRGDTKSPLKALFIASVTNIVLNLAAVAGFGWGAWAVGATTALANWVAALVLLRRLTRMEGILRFDPKALYVDRTELSGILKIGLPAGIQGMVFSVSNLVVQSAINSLGPDAIAASAAAFTIEINVYCVINAIGQGVTTFVGQNYGARNFRRCLSITKTGLILEVLLTTPIMIFVCVLGEPLLRFFNPDPTVVALGYIRILYVVLPEYISVGMEILSATLRGVGCSMPPAMASMAGICGSRVLWVWFVFPSSATFATLMAVYPLSWALTLVAIAVIYAKKRSELLKRAKEREALSSGA